MSIVNFLLVFGAVLAVIFSWEDIELITKKHRNK